MRRLSNIPLDRLSNAYSDGQNPGGAVDFSTVGMNAAFTPPWDPQAMQRMAPTVPVPNDLIGHAVMNHSQWGPWLDAIGAGQPGGVRIAGGFGNMTEPTQGLQAAGPSAQERNQRLAQMQNQSQQAANWYPNAKSYPYNPYPGQ